MSASRSLSGVQRTSSKPHPRCSMSTRLSWDFSCQHAAFKIAQSFALMPQTLSMTDRNEPIAPTCPHCRNTMQLVRHIAHLKELPVFYIFYCARWQRIETVKQERVA